MTVNRIMLKVCHGNQLKYIPVTREMTLTKALQIIAERFKLDTKEKIFQLGEVSGQVLTAKQYRHFISTFPKHNRIWYVKCESRIKKDPKKDGQGGMAIKRVSKRKLGESPPAIDDDEASVKRRCGEKMWAAPVRRQDCFINVYPEKSCGYSKRFETFRSTRLFSVRK